MKKLLFTLIAFISISVLASTILEKSFAGKFENNTSKIEQHNTSDNESFINVVSDKQAAPAAVNALIDRSGWIITASSEGPVDGTVAPLGDNPKYLIDGDNVTSFLFVKPGKSVGNVSVPDDGRKPYFEIDMGVKYEMNYLLYRHRDAANNSAASLRASKGSFYGKNSAEGEYDLISENFAIATDIAEVRIDLPQVVSYRYVKFVMEEWDTKTSNTIQVSEFNIGLKFGPETFYVKPNAASSAWSGKANVFTDFKAAYDAAVAGDNIWVAAGEYLIEDQITLKDVNVFGGFAGTESSIEERAMKSGGKAWEFENSSILKLNANKQMFKSNKGTSFNFDGMTLDGNKESEFVGRAFEILNSGNSIHISRCVIQNFKSNADGGAFNVRYRNIQISESLITNNEGNKGGAGYFDDEVLIRDSEISYNSVPTNFESYQGNTNGGGGGLFLANAGTGSTVYNCYIAHNTGSFGGGVFARNNAKIYNSIIVNNTSRAKGSGVAFDGRDNNATVYNSIIANNTSLLEDGAGVVFTATNGDKTNQKLQNCILYNNTDANDAVVNIGKHEGAGFISTPVILNNILDKEYDLGEFESVIESDPAKLFANLAEEDYTPVGDKDFPGFDKGNIAGLIFATGKDYAGNERVRGTIDIGPYELDPSVFTEQEVNLTVGEGVSSLTPNNITSTPTGTPVTFSFTIDTDSHHFPYASVNNDVYELTESAGEYSFTVPAEKVDVTLNVTVHAFPLNVFPVTKDTYVRNNNNQADVNLSNEKLIGVAGDISASYSNTKGYLYFDLDDYKESLANYRKAELKVVFESNNSKSFIEKLSVRTVKEQVKEEGLSTLTWNNSGEEASTYSGEEIAQGEVEMTTVSLLNVEDVVDLSSNVFEDLATAGELWYQLAMISDAGGDKNDGHLAWLHSFENGNPDFVPVLIFSEKYYKVALAKGEFVTILSPEGDSPFEVDEGEGFVLKFETDRELKSVTINGNEPAEGQLVETDGEYTLTIAEVTENLNIAIETTSVSVEQLNENVEVRVVENNLIIDTNQLTNVSVYNLSGQIVIQSVVNGNKSFELNRGVYLVKIADATYKISI